MTAMIEAPEGKSLVALIVPNLRRILLLLDTATSVDEKVKAALRALKSFALTIKAKLGDMDVSVGVEPARGSADSGDLETDLADLMVAVGEAAAARQRGVAIFIDELQYLTEDDLSALIMAIHRTNQRGLPVILVGAGLPQLVGLTGRPKSCAERPFSFPTIGPLDDRAARQAIEEPAEREGVAFDDGAIRAILRATQGYPYFLQVWASQSWNVADNSPVTAKDVDEATSLVLDRLDASFFRVRLDRLTPRKKHYLAAMARLGPGPHESGAVARALDVPVRSIAPTRASLIRQGMIYGPSHGLTAFTVPLFDEFMTRQMHAPEAP